MDEQDHNDGDDDDDEAERAANNPGRLGPSPTSTARKRTANVGSHSDLDSQSDSAIDSQPHSDSESDPDPESRPQSLPLAEGSRASATVTARTSPQSTTSPTAAAGAADTTTGTSRRMSAHIGRRHSRHMGDPSMFVSSSSSVGMDRSMEEGQRQGQGGQGQGRGQDAGNMSTSSMVVRPMPRRELLGDGLASLHDDSVATASESEGSMAADGIDRTRSWSSSAQERPRPSSSSSILRQVAEHRLSEIKSSSAPSSSKQTPAHPHHHNHPQQMSSTSAPPHISTVMTTRSSRVKDSITKDSAPRKWICKQVPVKTLGGEMMMPIWFS
ncbi:hypothetical protein BGZ90_005776, partial [Linnemannia elongata]